VPRRGPLPLQSASWIPFEDALERVYQRSGNARIAWTELFAIPNLPLKWISMASDPPLPRLLRAGERPEPDSSFSFTWSGNRETLGAGWRDELGFTLGDEPGWLYVWKPDFQKYFEEAVESISATGKQHRKSSENQGRPPAPEWEKVRAEAVRRCWRNGRFIAPESENKLAEALVDWAEDNIKKTKITFALSQMREVVKHTLATLKLIPR
jgi:hypothetical protein